MLIKENKLFLSRKIKQGKKAFFYKEKLIKENKADFFKENPIKENKTISSRKS